MSAPEGKLRGADPRLLLARQRPAPARAAGVLRALLTAAGLAWASAGCGPGSSPDSGPGAAPANYPNRSITLICPWAAGGGTDRVSRFVADQLQRRLGRPVIVVNKTGGSGAVGHLEGANARADGYTLTMGTFELNTMHWMGISPITHQRFEPVFQFNADAAAVLVRKDAPWNTLGALIEHIRQNPGKIKMSGTAAGGAWDLARAGMLLAAKIPVTAVLWVPSQGAAPSLVELLGGHVDTVCCSVPEAAALIEAGELRVLGVMSADRLAAYPTIPTLREQQLDWEAVGWRGLLLPKGTPAALVTLLEGHCRDIADSEEFKGFMDKNGFAIVRRGAAEFGAFMAQQDQLWRPVIEAAGYARN